MGERVYLIKTSAAGKKLSLYVASRQLARPYIHEGGWCEVGWLRYQLFRLGVING